MIWFWVGVFVLSLIALVKGADWLLESAERIGLAVGLSPFIVGVVIVGLGTSFPEVISALVAVLAGVTEIPVANAVGSNIANILLVVGISAMVAGKLTVTKNLIDLDLPLLAIATAIFFGLAWDGTITLFESITLLFLFLVYLFYSISYRDDEDADATLPSRADRRKHWTLKSLFTPPDIAKVDILMFLVGALLLVLGANYLVDSVVELSSLLAIATGAITLFAVALGTSIPELIVSIKAAWQKKAEVALGNVFGSNVFNLFFVVGLPGLFSTLTVDLETAALGLPVLAVVTLLFIISGISRRIHIYEGAMYVLIYIVFIEKLFGVM